MRPNEQKQAPTEKNLMPIRYGLQFHAQQAWMFSTSYIASYLNAHATQYAKDGEPDNDAASKVTGDAKTFDVPAMMAAGRLDWLMRETRPSLSGRLSERDVGALLDCYQGQILSPDNFNCIASDLCDHFGIELDQYETSRISRLVETLLDLTAIQRVTLADALEQTWYRGMKQENTSPKEFLATLGIDLT
jgi:hypothetical protein